MCLICDIEHYNFEKNPVYMFTTPVSHIVIYLLRITMIQNDPFINPIIIIFHHIVVSLIAYRFCKVKSKLEHIISYEHIILCLNSFDEI